MEDVVPRHPAEAGLELRAEEGQGEAHVDVRGHVRIRNVGGPLLPARRGGSLEQASLRPRRRPSRVPARRARPPTRRLGPGDQVLPARPPRGRAAGRTTAWRGSTCATPTPRRAGGGGLPAGGG